MTILAVRKKSGVRLRADVARGPSGPSAYAAWLAAGHVGSAADFLEWLKGERGGDGPPGPPGEGTFTDPGDLTLIFDNKLI